jgi:hypothetical protein
MNAAQRSRKRELEEVFDANDLWITSDEDGTVTVWDDVSNDGGDDDGGMIDDYVMRGEGDPDEIAAYFVDWLRVTADDQQEVGES